MTFSLPCGTRLSPKIIITGSCLSPYATWLFIIYQGAVDLCCVQLTRGIVDLKMLSILLLLGGCVKYEDI